MAPLDWDRLMAINPEDMEDDQADEMYNILEGYEPTGDEEPSRLCQLFRVARTVMQFKQTASEILTEEQTKFSKQTKIKEQDLRDEIEELKQELKNVKRYGSDTGGGGAAAAGRDQARFLRDEVHELERQVDLLQNELKEKDKQINNEIRAGERDKTRVEELERELKSLKRENERQADDIRDYQRQMESQRESLLSRGGKDVEFRDKMTKKNRELIEALEEVQNLTDANNDLQVKADEMRFKLEDAVRQMDRTTDEYMKLKTVLNQSDHALDQYKRENEILKAQIVDLTEQVQSKTDADDEIMVAVNNKVQEWKSVMADKDEEIAEYQEELARLREQLQAAKMDTEKASVSVLSKAVEQRDRQIELLQQKLDQAVADIETNTAVTEDLKGELKKTGGGPSDRQMAKIKELQTTLRIREDHNKDAEIRAEQAEKDAREKDQQLNEALEKMKQYEEGTYGLKEAVDDIKDLKHQLNVKDRQIMELTQHINKCELKINDVCDENEAVRRKAGLEAKDIDLSEFREARKLRQQEDRAMNVVLQKEVESLEEERIELKKQVRKLAQQTGQRAVALGLDADDMMAIENYTEELKQRHKTGGTAAYIKQEAETDELKIRNVQLAQETESNVKALEKARQQLVEFRTKLNAAEDENKKLEQGMKEILQALKEQNEDKESRGEQPTVIECPTLDRMLAALEAKQMKGQYDTSLHLKAQVDNLQGRNDELRRELREARFEANKARSEAEKTLERVTKLQNDIKVLQEAGAGAGMLQTLALPEGMAPTSADVIASLNEHLVQTIQELSLKEEMINKMEASLETFKRKFAVMRHQQGLVYQEYIQEKKTWEEDKQKLENDLKNSEGIHSEDKVRLQEFDRLLDTLSKDDIEVRRRLADMTRKITVLRVNEKALTRRYNSMQEVEGYLRKEGNKLKNEMVAMETAVTERLGYLQRYKDMAAFKIASLQKALEDSVPMSELELANKQYNDLTEKYRDLLEKGNTLVAQSESTAGLESEIKRLQHENDGLKKEMEIEKEKLHTLEGAMDEMRKQGIPGTGAISDAGIVSLSKKITTLEMKELNERQRAEHAVRMYEQQKGALRGMEERNADLEQKFAELTKMNIEAQRVERELRDELANCVTRAVSEADRKKVAELSQSEAFLKNEVSRLKEIAEVGTMQAQAYEAQQVSREKELLSLRQQLADIQAQSDEKTIIGKLHRHIVQLQVSEGTAVRKLLQAEKKIKKLDAQLLRLQQRLDERDQTLYHSRQEANNKSKHLKRTIQELRRQFSGAVPLSRQEKFAKAMVQLHEDKSEIECRLREVNEQRQDVEDKLAELELQHKGLQELMASIKDGKGAQKVVEWHSKMESLRLEDLKQKRMITKMQEQARYFENLNKNQEKTIAELEEENVKTSKYYDDRQLLWEQREVELERIIASMEKQQAEIAGAASKFEEATGALPDPSLPVANQLEQAITTIKQNVKTILETQVQHKQLKQKVLELEHALREAESNVISRDKVIAELRVRLPATAGRDEMILHATAKATEAALAEDYETKQALKVAQSTIGSLQARIAQKDETIQKYQDLLRQVREDMQDMGKKHEQEMKLLQDKLHSKNDDAFSKFKQTAMQLINKPQDTLPTSKQLARLNELEDTVAEQDNAMAAMTEKLKAAREQIERWKLKLEDSVKTMTQEKERMLDEHQSMVAQLKEQLERYVERVAEQEKEMEVLQQELITQKDANARAPTTAMKNLVERLKNQLAAKEKQQQALSKALTELRADMVSQAQEQVKSHAEEAAVEINVQRVVEKNTKELKDQIEDLDSQLQRAKRELKKRREKETALNTEIEELKEDLTKRESQVTKLKETKLKLEHDVEELEKRAERLSASKSQKTVEPDGRQLELEELRRKIRLLEDELKRKQQAEKPYEVKAELEPRVMKSDDTVARWEESKKWQKTVDRLRARLKEKEEEVDRVQRHADLTKNALDRANRDKESLESRLKATGKSTVVPTGRSTHNLEELRRKNYELEEQVADLKRQITQGRDAAFEEVQLRNKFLTEKLEELERQLARRTLTGQAPGPESQAYQQLYDKEQSLQKQVIRLSEENIELRFEAEQAAKDIPRLKERIEDLQRYVEVLKSENLNTSARSSGGNIKKIGESGKSTRELEKTIALLKKVVERVQAENETLKKAPGIVSNEELQMLARENEGLKDQLEELRQKMGATLTERYSSAQKGTAKIMTDYERLRKDLKKETDLNEKLRIQNNQLETENKHLEKELEETKEKLKIEQAKHPSLSSLDSKGWKSVVVTRMYEDKLKGLEGEMERKNQQLNDLKQLLKDAAEREQGWLKEKEDMEEKIEVLETFPMEDSSTNPDTMRAYQQARLTIDRLEKEKAELLHELRLFGQQPGAGKVASGAAEKATEDMIYKVRAYEKVMRENVEIRTDLKSVMLDRDKLAMEVDKLKKELANFGPEFFEEIEDLKYNYREAVQKNVQYEEQLSNISKQFGVAVNIPGAGM